jgi:hypothetical protein
MASQRATGQRFRQRKLSTKQNLPVVREHEVEQLADDDASRHIPKVETGVEKGEEIVSHPNRFGFSPFPYYRHNQLRCIHDASCVAYNTQLTFCCTHANTISRSTISKPSSLPPRQALLVGRLPNSSFPLQMPSPVNCSMKTFTQNASHNQPRTFGSRRP